MKSFRRIINESGYGYDRSAIPHEVRMANEHVYDLVRMDGKMRRSTRQVIDNPYLLNTLPLEYNMPVLEAISNHFLGTTFADKFPNHAKKLDDYRKQVEEEYPHLVGLLAPKTY